MINTRTNMRMYTVKSGDSLSRIAANVLGNMALWSRLALTNNIAAPYHIFPGQVLRLPLISGATATGGAKIVMPVAPVAPVAPDSVVKAGEIPAPGSGGIVQWLIQNKLLVGGGVVLVAVIALALGRKKK